MTAYTCWIPDYGHERDDGRSVYALDAEQAARIYIEIYEQRNAEYTVASGGTAVVAVAAGQAEPEMYTVSGEAMPVYYARRQHA